MPALSRHRAFIRKNVIVASLVAAVSAVATSARAGLVGSWQLNGNLLDSSGNGNNGNSTGIFGTADYVPNQLGVPNSAFSYPTVIVNDSPTIDLSAASGFTVSAWVNLIPAQYSSVHEWPIVYNYLNSGTTDSDPNFSGSIGQFSLFYRDLTPATIALDLTVAGNQSQNPSTVETTLTLPANGAWVNLAASFDLHSQTATIYVNGQAAAASIFPGLTQVGNTSSKMAFVAGSNSGSAPNALSNVQLYNNAVSNQTIAANYVQTAHSTVPAPGMSQITFFVEDATQSRPFGHAYLELSQGSASYFDGFVNSFKSPFSPGHIQGERGSPWAWDITFNIPESQYIAVLQAIENDTAHPHFYNVITFNCVDWILRMANIAGVTLPQTYDRTAVYPISKPSILQTNLALIGAGNGFAGGIVGKNSSSFPSAPLPGLPQDYDYTSLEQVAHSNPSTVGSLLQETVDMVDVGSITSNSADGMQLALLGTDPSESMISMDWGDGSPLEEQITTLSHIYAAGSYTADLVVIDAGAVHDYKMSVLVSSGSGSSLALNVAQFDASTTLNSGLLPAEIPSVPEPTSIAILVCGFAGIMVGRRK